ncbi:alpha/beta hydrolase-fold protein [Porphyrobacter sp. YT40]|uniref:alpha/beta hydrolase n=1 Tax=Porphyrobacter sp. YT40 TaxID=2547601 RepID=UPI0015E8BA17|nr:alpha/beta hydrolase-fold protein [Porphyrobacter sp. YT40]
MAIAVSTAAHAQVPADHAVLADPEGEPIVIGSAHRIPSSVYGETKLVTVRLPRGYADDPERRYPVIFSIDGGPEQDFELLAGIAAEAEFSTSFEPFILIGVRTDNRYAELTPPLARMAPETLTALFGERMQPNGAPRFREFLARDVIPWVTSRYRTERKVLTAASLGGLFVVDTLLERPDMFDDYIALTPSIWWDEGRVAEEAAAKLAAHARSDRRIYFTMGDEGVGNLSGKWLGTLVSAFETSTPEGLKWAFVDRSASEEHRTMALMGWLDAFRTLYLTPARTGSPIPFLYDGGRALGYTAGARANLDAGTCRHAIARPATWAEKNAAPGAFYGWCLLMKPGAALTAGNFGPDDFGRGKLPSITPPSPPPAADP